MEIRSGLALAGTASDGDSKHGAERSIGYAHVAGVESSRRLPFPRSPFASAVRMIFSAGLSLTEPPG